MSLQRKFKRQNQGKGVLTPKEYADLAEEIKRQTIEQMVLKALVIGCNIVNKEYGKLKAKDKRAETFAERFIEEINNVSGTLDPYELQRQLKEMGVEVRFTK